MFSNKEIEQYLHRIKFSSAITLSSETLSGLQKAHIATVPYENLDILRGIPLSVDPHIIYKKVVENRRGGFCFELNGLFAELLVSLGFTVVSYLSRFLFNRPEDLPIPTHRVLKVTCDVGTFIADVGTFVDAPHTALRFVKEEVQTDGCQSYMYREDPVLGQVLYQFDKETGAWKRFYSFMEYPFTHNDFAAPSFYTEKHPDSRFAKEPMISIKKEDEYIVLYGNKLIRTKNSVTSKQIIEDADFESILFDFFNLQ